MVDIPEQLARSIQAGDCIVWVGAALGRLAGRPTWEQLLRRLVPECPADAHASLEKLLEQGRLRTVLTYVHRHLGDEPLARLLKQVSDEHRDVDLAVGASGLAELPWNACFATTYPDVVQRIFASVGRDPEVISHHAVHGLSLRDPRDFFILRTPPTGRPMRLDNTLFDFVEEALRSRTVLFLGFEPDDPDLAQILDLVDRIGRGNRHFAALPGVSAPEAEDWSDRFGIEVIRLADGTPLVDALADLVAACADVAVRPVDVAGRLAVLDLTRAVRSVDVRADLGLDAGLGLDGALVERLVANLPGDNFAMTPASTLLRAGAAVLAHGHLELARRCFQHVSAAVDAGELLHVARFNLALCALAEGDHEAAREGLVAAAEADRSLAIVPPRFEILEVLGRSGTGLRLSCRDRSRDERYAIDVATLPRPVGRLEEAAFETSVQQLSAVDHPAVCRALGGFADGRLFGVMYALQAGFGLDETLAADEHLTLGAAWEIVSPLIDGLRACHRHGVFHRNLTPSNVLLAPAGAMLRGFGFPPVLGHRRASVREINFGYLAPELAGRGEPGPGADVFGLAAVLYRCLVGHPPVAFAAAPSASDAELDPRLDSLLAAALHPDPAARSSLDELAEQLEHIVASPEIGRAQRWVGVEGAPGHERVVDLGPPHGRVSDVADAAGASEAQDLAGWAAVLEHKPTHPQARESVARIEADARARGRWDVVVEALALRERHIQLKRERVDLMRERATIYEDQLGAPRDAYAVVRSIVDEVDPAEQVLLTHELERLARATGAWPALAEALAVVADRIGDPQEAATLHARLSAVFAEHLGEPDRAIEALARAVELVPEVEGLARLAELQQRAGHHSDHARSLLVLADHQADAERHATLVRAAECLRDAVDDDEGALAAAQVVLEEDPQHVEALEVAETAARRLGHDALVLDVLSRRADASLDTREVLELRREAASLALGVLDDREASIDQLARLLAHNRTDEDAARQLVGLLRAVVVENPSRGPELIDALGVLAEGSSSSDQERAELLSEAAALLDAEPDGAERAADCRERILELTAVDHGLARAAAAELERSYRERGAHRELERMLLRVAQSDSTPLEARVLAWSKLVELRSGPLDDDDGVVEALETLTLLDPAATKWRDALLARYLAREDYHQAGPLIRTQVTEETDPARKAELLVRGGLLREQIGKPEGAAEALEEAVSLDPARTDAWLALRDLYAQSDQPLKSVEALVSAADHTRNRVEKTRMLFEAATAFLGELDRSDQAVALLERVIEHDPDHRDATGLLLEQLDASGDLERALPYAQIYAVQVHARDPHDARLNLDALVLAGRCALAVGDNAKAREYLEKAKQFDAANLAVLRRLADLDLAEGNHAEALQNYQSVILGAGDGLGPQDASTMYVRMAEARLGLGERTKSAQTLERALDLDPDNEAAIERLIALGPDVGGPDAVVRAKRRLVDLLARHERAHAHDPEALAHTRTRQADLLHEIALAHLAEQRPLDAIATFEHMLETRPGDPAVLHRMLDILTEAERWRDALNVLRRLADGRDDGESRAKYLYAGALVSLENLGDRVGAAQWSKEALEADPRHDRAFDVHAQLMEEERAWADLARAIRTHLKALGKDAAAERLVELFGRLGEAYEHLEDPKTAIAAYDQAARLGARADDRERDQIDRRLRVMQLAVALGDDELDKAAHHGHAIIVANPMEFAVYHRLIELYLQRGDRDRARVVARTLCFVKQANEAELALVEAGGGPSQVRSAVSRGEWRKAIEHPLANRRLSDIFAATWALVAAREGHTHDHHRLTRGSRVDVSLQSPTAFARYLAHACQGLDVPVPDLYLGDEGSKIVIDALAEGNGAKRTVYPSVIVGKDALPDTSESAMKFRAGRVICRVKAEHLLTRVLASTASLRHVGWGALRVAQPELAVPLDVQDSSQAYARLFEKYLPPATRDQLQTLAKGIASDADIDVSAWSQGATYTVTRAGFVLCDNIEVAAQVMTREEDSNSEVSAKDRMADLIAYSVSEPYLALRKSIGLAR